MSEVHIKYDAGADVLYVRRDGATIHRSKEAEHDGYLVLNMNSQSEVVGVQLLCAKEMPATTWHEHPDKERIPLDIFNAVEDWTSLPI